MSGDRRSGKPAGDIASRIRRQLELADTLDGMRSREAVRAVLDVRDWAFLDGRDEYELGWGRGYNAALAAARVVMAEALGISDSPTADEAGSHATEAAVGAPPSPSCREQRESLPLGEPDDFDVDEDKRLEVTADAATGLEGR